MKKTIIFFFFIIFLVLSLVVEGKKGNIQLENYDKSYWVDNGPFELQRGRFILTYSVLEDHSTKFSPDISGFALPDLGYSNGDYVSIFAPGTAYLAMPGYLIGKSFGLPQVGSYFTITMFAFLNCVLVYLITKKLGVNSIASLISAMIFLFATPAFSYATVLYQHHITTFLMLLGILPLIKSKVNIVDLSLVFILIAISVVVDYPNAIIFMPLGLLAISKFIDVKNKKNFIKLKVKPFLSFSMISIIPVVLLLLLYNKVTYGNYFQFAGTVKDVVEVRDGEPLFETDMNEDVSMKTHNNETKTAVGFFKTRNLINGLYTHVLSPDRGIIIYCPILLFSFLGGYILFKKKDRYLWFFISTVGLNLVLYSLWGDPWGGWGFGSRYLIPAYSLMSILIGFSFTKIKRSKFTQIIFVSILFYSLVVNTLGAVTSKANVPRVEAEALSVISGIDQKYTFERNVDLLNEGKLKSFVYYNYLSQKISAWEYYLFVLGIPMGVFVFLLLKYFKYFNIKFVKDGKDDTINLID